MLHVLIFTLSHLLTEESYNDFVDDLKDAESKRECRYGVFDAEFLLANGQKRSKLIFFLWYVIFF